ncbi:MAG: PIN domain-containing protein [Bdellovibrionales bacterium]|jgi:predicted nucleic acid-binding protein|nr:PIN domain-containing protein [Bdellovibrionales bacterium]
MTALDTNILVGVMVSSSSYHKEAMEGLSNLEDDLCTTPTNIGEVLRLLTHSKVFPSPLKIEKAVEALEQLIEAYDIRILDEETSWWKQLPEIARQILGLKGNEIFDARIAICLKQHKVKRIFTRDADFKKYSFLQTISFFSK